MIVDKKIATEQANVPNRISVADRPMSSFLPIIPLSALIPLHSTLHSPFKLSLTPSWRLRGPLLSACSAK